MILRLLEIVLIYGTFIYTYTWQCYNLKDDTKLYCGHIQQLLMKIKQFPQNYSESLNHKCSWVMSSCRADIQLTQNQTLAFLNHLMHLKMVFYFLFFFKRLVTSFPLKCKLFKLRTTSSSWFIQYAHCNGTTT